MATISLRKQSRACEIIDHNVDESEFLIKLTNGKSSWECISKIEGDKKLRKLLFQYKKRDTGYFGVKKIVSQRYNKGALEILVQRSEYEMPTFNWVDGNVFGFDPCAYVDQTKMPPRSVPKSLAGSEWLVFKTYFLAEFQREFRCGWHNSSSRTGNICHGGATFCTQQIFTRLLAGSTYQLLKKKTMLHAVFSSAADIPAMLVGIPSVEMEMEMHPLWGRVELAWWRVERDTQEVFTNRRTGQFAKERELYQLVGPVIVYFHPIKHRISFSFTFSKSTRNVIYPSWIVHQGPSPTRK